MFGLVPFKINNNFVDSKNGFDSMFKDFFGYEIKAKFENGVLEITIRKEQKAIEENSSIEIK